MEMNENDNNQPRQEAESIAGEVAIPHESNVAPNSLAAESNAPIDNKNTESISFKDRWTLIISCSALLLSVAGFYYQIHNTSIQNARAQNQEARIQKQEVTAQEQVAKAQRQARTHAYNLGKHFTLAYFVFLQTTKGDPKDIAAAQQEAKLHLVQNTRELAIALELDPDLSIYLVKKEPGGVFGSYGAFRSLEKKISSFNTEETVAAFNVGYSLWFLNLERAAADALRMQEPFRKIFPVFREHLNRNLKTLGVGDESMLPDFDNMENVGRRLHDMKIKYDVELGGGN